jgi:hypothetical protein
MGILQVYKITGYSFHIKRVWTSGGIVTRRAFKVKTGLKLLKKSKD